MMELQFSTSLLLVKFLIKINSRFGKYVALFINIPYLFYDDLNIFLVQITYGM